MKRIVLVGATGLVGSFCLELLLNSPEIAQVIVITRRPLQQTHIKLKEYLIDFSQIDQLTLSEFPIDSALCCLGTTMKQAGSKQQFRQVDFEYVISFARWCLKQGVQHFATVSSIGADEKSIFFYNRIKGETEAELAKLGFKALDIFRPSLLVGARKTLRAGEKLGEKILGVLHPILRGLFSSLRPTPAESVAKIMLRCSLNFKPGIKIHLPDEIRLN